MKKSFQSYDNLYHFPYVKIYEQNKFQAQKQNIINHLKPLT